MVKYILMVNLQLRIRFKMDYYWMQGDNRHNSADSRYWGFVPETILWVNHYLYGGRATQIVVDLAAYGGTDCLVGVDNIK